MGRNYASEANWEAEKYIHLTAKPDKEPVEDFKAKLADEGLTYAGWLRDRTEDYRIKVNIKELWHERNSSFICIKRYNQFLVISSSIHPSTSSFTSIAGSKTGAASGWAVIRVTSDCI